MLSDILEGKLGALGKRMDHLIFKLVVEENLMGNLLAAGMEVDLREESKIPLGEWLDRWLEEYAAPSVRPSTLEGYRGYIERNIKPHLGSKPVSKITAEDIRQLYRELQEHGRQEEHPQYGYKLAGSTIRRIHGVLHEALDATAQEDLIARNPTDGIVLPRKKTAPKQVLNDH